MNVNFVRFDPATGRVEGIGNCSEPDLDGNRDLYPDLGFLVAQADLDRDYVDLSADPPAVRPRPALAGFDRLTIRADGADAARLVADVPFSGTLDGRPFAVDVPEADGSYLLEFTADVPAGYSVTVEAFPYLPYAAELVAQ